MASIRNAGTLRAGVRARQAQGYDNSLSKSVELNGKYRLFFRIAKPGDVAYVENGQQVLVEAPDIIACTVPGRSLDYKALGYGYIPFDEKLGQIQIDDSGKYTDTSGLAPIARIAKVLHAAQCEREKKAAEKEAKEAAESLGQQIDTVTLARTLEGIEQKYHGGKAANGQNVLATVQPVVSRLQQKITIQICVVKLDPTGKPDWDNAVYAVFEASNARANELFALIDNPEYCRPEDGFLEVGYDYIGKDKKEAGRNAKFQGIAASLSLKTQYPEEWAKAGQAKVDGIVHGATVEETANMMKARNMSVARAISPNDVISAFRKYCATNAAVFASIDMEADSTKWAAQDFLESHLLDAYPVVKQKFIDLKAAMDKESGNASNDLEAAAQVAAPQVEAPQVVETVTDEAHDADVAKAIAATAGTGNATLRQLTEAVGGDLDSMNDGLGEIGEL